MELFSVTVILIVGAVGCTDTAQDDNRGESNVSTTVIYSEQTESASDPVRTALVGATLIDGTDAPPVENSVIVLEGERILDVGPFGDIDVGDAVIRDLSGEFVVPGFFNTHAHIQQGMSRPFLAFGITTIRNPGPSEPNGIPLRDKLNAGEVVGPRMYTAGPIINNSEAFSLAPSQVVNGDTGTGSNNAEVRSPDDVRAEVNRQAAAGFDFIKVYMGIEPPLLRAAVEAADEHNVPTIGHLKVTSWTMAAEIGLHVLVHSCSEGPTWELLSVPDRNANDWSNWSASVRSWAATAHKIDFKDERWKALIGALVSNEAEVNPTLSTLEALYWADDSARLSGEQPDFAPEGFADAWRGQWESQSNFMASYGFSPEDYGNFKMAFPACLKMVNEMRARGVLLTAGDDIGGWMTPGVSFHRELQLLADAGIPNEDIIRIATRNGAEALGILDEVGTIQPGKRADLVVLDKNPLVNIRNTQSIITVVHDGKFYHPRELLSE